MMDRPGYIYIIKADTGHYKIGRSNNVPKRMSLFAVKLPFDFEIIHTFPCDDAIEAERGLHEAGKMHGHHVKGEWFNFPDSYLYPIKQIGRFEGGQYYIDRNSPLYD
jgi:Meiotically Up-regulated Gene 113 (MUG113) protein